MVELRNRHISRPSEINTNVTIVGTGICGLTLAYLFARSGNQVALVDKAGDVAHGATTRNEGWLHAGTYHAAAIEDPVMARQVVTRTRFGHDSIRRYAPQAIEDQPPDSYAVFRDPENLERAQQRWKEMNVPHKEISLGIFNRINPEVNTENLVGAFMVDDQSVNTTILCSRLVTDIHNAGGKFYMKSELTPEDEHMARIKTPKGDISVRSDFFIVAAGAGIKPFFENFLQKPFPMRFIQSHLLIMPRLLINGVFEMEPGGAGVMNHTKSSVVGVNKDGIQMTEPSYIPNPAKKNLIHAAVTKLIPHSTHYRRYSVVACVKPDVYKDSSDIMNLNAQFDEVTPSWFYALPGKMTEAPFVANAAFALLSGDRKPTSTSNKRSRLPYVTPRPLDKFRSLPGAQ